MSKPSIILVPGSFGGPEFYEPVVNAVAAKGYSIRALQMPSVGLKSDTTGRAPPSMYDDAAFIAAETRKLADEGKDVLLIAHSYGGTPATESTKGLGKEERETQGKKGGLVRLAYMTALVPAVGTAAGGVSAGVQSEIRTEPQVDVRAVPSLFQSTR